MNTRVSPTHPLASVAMPTSVSFIPTPGRREMQRHSDHVYWLVYSGSVFVGEGGTPGSPFLQKPLFSAFSWHGLL